MSEGLLLGMASALWFGILMSISPCPLATNIAAISYIGRRIDHPRTVVATGLLYMIGRSVVYVALGAILVASLLSAPTVSQLLQKYMNKLLGPVLILVGMILLELIRFRTSGAGLGERLGKRVENWGIWGGLALGMIFALSFCPGSAALFFGSLITLSIKYESSFLLPLLFGAGSALPVALFAILVAVGTRAVGQAFNRISQFEWWARRITGTIFIIVGVYFSLTFIFRLL